MDQLIQRAPSVVISVTKEEIKMACRRDERRCMIRDAIKRTIPSAKTISVDARFIRWSDPQEGLRYDYATPHVAEVALAEFDAGNPNIKPFSFKLRRGHVYTMRKGGESNRRQVHKLGKHRFVVSGKDVSSIGGRPVRIGKMHPSHHTIRVFGTGSWTREELERLDWMWDRTKRAKVQEISASP